MPPQAAPGFPEWARAGGGIARNFLDAREPDALAIAELVELALLRAQHAAEVMGSVAVHHRGVAREPFNEKSAAHAGDSTLSGYLECGGLACLPQAGRRFLGLSGVRGVADRRNLKILVHRESESKTL